MDTRFWGPPGWRILHLISVSDVGISPAAADFFEQLAYVLPCKFCRASYTEYITADPVRRPPHLSKRGVAEWLWRIHNQVNAKLRAQHLPTAPDPAFSRVWTMYKDRLRAGCTRTEFEGWDFFFAIAECHPFSRQARASKPMEGAPARGAEAVESKEELNRWNLMTPEERFVEYKKFWKLVGKVLPFAEWRAAWKELSDEELGSRKALLKALWERRCEIDNRLEDLNRERFDEVCQRLSMARSGCGARRRAKTCRASVRTVRGGRRTRRSI